MLGWNLLRQPSSIKFDFTLELGCQSEESTVVYLEVEILHPV